MDDASASWASIPYLDRLAMKNSSFKEQGPKGPVLPTDRSGPVLPIGCTYPKCDCAVECMGVGPDTSRLDREEIKREIRELDSLRLEQASQELADLCYHRINELLDLLDNAD